MKLALAFLCSTAVLSSEARASDPTGVIVESTTHEGVIVESTTKEAVARRGPAPGPKVNPSQSQSGTVVVDWVFSWDGWIGQILQLLLR